MKKETKPEIQIDIRPLEIESAIVSAPFDEAKKALENQGYNIISLEENARLRIQQGGNAYVSRKGNWTRECFVYDKNKGIYLTRNSPIMENAEEATQSHWEEKDYLLIDKQVEQALEDSVKIPKNIKPIPTNRFGENEITRYAFGEIAEQYGQFLEDVGIVGMPVRIAGLNAKPFARQVWFWRLGVRSGLGGDYRLLDGDGRLRGVKIGRET